MSSFTSVNPLSAGKKVQDPTDITAIYQEWKTAQFEEEDNELLLKIKEMVMSEQPLSMFVQLHTSNILLWGVEKVKNEMVSSWQNQVCILVYCSSQFYLNQAF